MQEELPADGGSATAGSCLTGVLRTSLARIEALGLPFAELRPRIGVPGQTEFDDDHDFLVAQAQVTEVVTILLEECLRHGASLAYRGDHRNKRVVELVSGARRIRIELWCRVEVWHDRTEAGRAEIDAAAILAAMGAAGGAGAPGLVAALYLANLYCRNKDVAAPKQQARLRHFCARLDAAGAAGEAAALRRVLQGLIDGSMSLPEANRAALDHLAAAGLAAARVGPLARFRDRLARAWRLPGRIVPVIGPDGAGKTYLCRTIVERHPERFLYIRFKDIFRRSFDYWAIQKSFAFLGQHSASQIDEIIFAYIILKSIALIPVLRQYLVVRRRTAVVDRYMWDYLVRDAKLAGTVPRRVGMHRLFRGIIPRPGRCLVVLCSTETIFARKQEISAEQIAFIYREHIGNVTAGYAAQAFFYNSERDYDSARPQIEAFLGA